MKRKVKTDTQLLEQIIIETADIKVRINEISEKLQVHDETLHNGLRNVDRFMLLHEKLFHEVTAIKADLERTKKAVRALGGKVD